MLRPCRPPLAWYDGTNGEIGDICNAQQGTFVGTDAVTYTVQKQFSNAAADCIVSRSVSPIITSPATTTFVKGHPGSFTAKATGYPNPTFSKAGALPGGVTLSSAGIMAGTPTATGTFPITITATNGVGSPATQSFTLKVVSIKITTTSLGTAKKGTAYSRQLTELGGTAPFTWTNTTPKLPAGLTLSTAGKITGSVKSSVAGGTYSVGISVHDNSLPTPKTASAVLKITVH